MNTECTGNPLHHTHNAYLLVMEQLVVGQLTRMVQRKCRRSRRSNGMGVNAMRVKSNIREKLSPLPTLTFVVDGAVGNVATNPVDRAREDEDDKEGARDECVPNEAANASGADGMVA